MVKGLALGVVTIVFAACAVKVDPKYTLVTGTGAEGTSATGTITSCLPTGGACVSDQDCCEGFCNSAGLCEAAACVAVGGNCASATDCCQAPGPETCLMQTGSPDLCFACCSVSAQCTPGCCVPIAGGGSCTGVCVASGGASCLP